MAIARVMYWKEIPVQVLAEDGSDRFSVQLDSAFQEAVDAIAMLDGSAGTDDAYALRHELGIGAEIMGAGKYGPPGWHEDPDWKGWWGPNPPFHTPVYVLTHHTREPIEMEGGTTFHFVDAPPEAALKQAQEAADGQDVRIGGGPTVVRDFLAAGLVDHVHVVQVPILLGRGVRLWDGLEDLQERYAIEAVTSSSGVTHLTLTRRTATG
jgi:dihydrofolate reductase